MEKRNIQTGVESEGLPVAPEAVTSGVEFSSNLATRVYRMKQSPVDPVLFTERRDSAVVGADIIHVDDFICTGNKFL